MTYFMKVLAAIAQFFIFVNAMKGEWRCLSALQLTDIYSKKKKRGKESSGKTLMLTWGLFCFRIPTLYLFFGDCGKAFGFWNEMNLLCNFWGDDKKKKWFKRGVVSSSFSSNELPFFQPCRGRLHTRRLFLERRKSSWYEKSFTLQSFIFSKTPLLSFV